MAAASMPWVKIYTEIIDDPKMMELSTSAKWRFVQFIALAGQFDMSGFLTDGDVPMSVKKIAWRLRETPQTIQADLDELKAVGLMGEVDGAICVTNFTARQGRPQSERQKQWRERQRAKRDKDKTAAKDDAEEHHADHVTDVTRDATVTRRPRVEKSREDKNSASEQEIPPEPEIPPAGADAPCVPTEHNEMDNNHEKFCLPDETKRNRRIIETITRDASETSMVLSFLGFLPLQLTKASAKTQIAAARDIIGGGGTEADLRRAWLDSRGQNGQRPFTVNDLHSLKGRTLAIAAERRSKPAPTTPAVTEADFIYN